MSVATFDPYTVDVTREAAARLRAQLAARWRHPATGCQESGCNGYSYTLDYTDTTATSDIVVQVDDTLAIHIAEADLPLVRGTRVDYVRDGLNATLQFKNARATSYCGCGEFCHRKLMERRIVPIARAVEARLVPTGDPITLPGGIFVTLTQDLGGTFTVVHQGRMARIDGEDADALGLPPTRLQFAPPADGQVDREQVMTALRSVYDPEIPVNIVDLGLVYDVTISAGGVIVTMTLTSPGCGMGPVLVHEVKRRVGQVPFVQTVTVDLVLDPPWSRDRMSEEAQLELGLF